MSGINKNCLVIIPTYNEAENIVLFLNELLQIDIDVLVVDDNSPDGTGELVNNIAKTNSSLFLLTRPEKQGLGSAYRAGFDWGIEKKYTSFVEMDADFSHRIVDLKSMLSIGSKYDLVIGSRYIHLGGTSGWSVGRKLLSKTANLFAGIMLRTRVKDLTSGFRIYSLNALEEILFQTSTTNGYGFQIEMTIRSVDKKLKIKEIPILFEERREGSSKMDSKIILEAFILVFKLFPKRYLGIKVVS